MSYSPFYTGGWQSGENGGTPITPEALNHMEEGIRRAFSELGLVATDPNNDGNIVLSYGGVVEDGGGSGGSGGNVDYVGVEPAEDDIPKVFITGVKPTTKDDVLAEMQYISKTDNFHAYLEIKCQGTSSMSYAKKNFTVKLYSDEARETKIKKVFRNWGIASNKFVLKANYIDHSHARNVVSANLWSEVVASRSDYDSLPEELRTSPNHGAVDGFPVKVYYNGTYEGIYTWNIGKDAWMWGMDEDNTNHALLCAEGNTDGVYAETTSNFRKLWDGVDGSKPGWSVEVGTNSAALKTSLNNLIQFVMDNDGDDFRNGIGTYLDIQSAIDYYIFQYEICGLDGLAHNMLLATYDGVVWRCGAYDLDATFGLWWDGTKFISATYACPEDYQERYSLLWERIEANFRDELKARQVELRKTVLSYSNMVTHFERFMDIIGLDLYAEDLTIYTGIPSGSTNNIKQIRNFIRDRQAYVDAEFAAMSDPVPCEGISLDKSTLTFTEEGTQTLTATVTPDGCTDPVMWESDNTSVAIVNGGVVTPIANGSTTITAKCGEYSASCAVEVSLSTGIPEPIEAIEETVIVNLQSGIAIKSEDGNEIADETAYGSEEYYAIPDGLTVFVHELTSGWSSLAFYDADKIYISGLSKTAASTEECVVPSGAKYLRVAYWDITETTVTLRFIKQAVWSDSAVYGITNDGAYKIGTGDAYISSRVSIPEGATVAVLANANDGAYKYKEIHSFDSAGAHISRETDNGSTIKTKLTDLSGAVYVQATAYPDNNAVNNDPNNQLVLLVL